MASARLSPSEIRILLSELADNLDTRGVRARIFVIGGAAMALAYYEREGTNDVDAVFAPAEAVSDAAREVGRRHGLYDDWLNDSAGMYLPPSVGLESGRPTIESGGVHIAAAPADLMLAMKLRASRGRRDVEDIAVLVRHTGVTTVGAATDLYESFYPEDPLPQRATRALEAAFGEFHITTAGEPIYLAPVEGGAQAGRFTCDRGIATADARCCAERGHDGPCTPAGGPADDVDIGLGDPEPKTASGPQGGFVRSYRRSNGTTVRGHPRRSTK